MASIFERRGKDGKVSYRVLVRLKGAPTQVATFDRKTDAKIWAQQTEALILGQFLAFQDSALNCLRGANYQDGFYHTERYFMLASKLFAQANTTMQTLLKYRSGGQKTVQVVHVHNEKGQTIVAQNFSPSSGEGGGVNKKQGMDPMVEL